MSLRPGRRPVPPTGPTATLTVRIPADVKTYLIATSDALDMSITEYLLILIRRDAYTGD